MWKCLYVLSGKLWFPAYFRNSFCPSKCVYVFVHLWVCVHDHRCRTWLRAVTDGPGILFLPLRLLFLPFFLFPSRSQKHDYCTFSVIISSSTYKSILLLYCNSCMSAYNTIHLAFCEYAILVKTTHFDHCLDYWWPIFGATVWECCFILSSFYTS